MGKLPASDPRLPALTERAADAGITVRIADMDAFPAELERIYDIVVDSFGDNFLYTPIDRHEFLTQYAQVQPYVRPEHVLIAEQNMEPVGFIFTVPDLSQQLRGEPVDTLVIKTVAVRPQVAGHGLGSLLGARVQAAAHALGFRNVIHALMHETKSLAQYQSPLRIANAPLRARLRKNWRVDRHQSIGEERSPDIQQAPHNWRRLFHTQPIHVHLPGGSRRPHS